MKLSKKLFFLLGIIILGVGVVYGYLGFRKYLIRRELNLAKTYYENGNLSSAVGHLHNVAEKAQNSPDRIEAIYLLGKSYLSLDELDLARPYWERLQNLPQNHNWKAECFFSLAVIAKETGEISRAIEYYEKIIKEYPQSALADDAMWNLSLIYRSNAKLLMAKQMLDTIIENYPQSNLIASIQKESGEINIELLFSQRITPDSTEYIVKQGDTLIGIAQEFNSTVDLIKTCNKLKSNFIKPGDSLKVITAKFSLVVDKSRNTLILKADKISPSGEKLDEKVVKVYSVGTGLGGSTPAGEFKITNKLINPPWHKAGMGVIPYGDPQNILGTRWLGIDIGGYGIHGTWKPETIGKQASAGCIRMYNEDVEELFRIIPIGTSVTVVE